MTLRRLDLGPGDVHRDGAAKRVRSFEAPSDALPRRAPTGVPEPGSNEDPGTWISTRSKSVGKTKAISTKKRKSLKPGQFALPEKKAYPIDTAARVRNAAARLEQNKGSLSPAEYRKARSAIASAAKRFGIQSEYAKKGRAARMDASPGTDPQGDPRDEGIEVARGRPGTVKVDVVSYQNGRRRVQVLHMADRVGYGEGLPVELVEVFAKLADAERRAKALPDGPEKHALEAEVAKLSDEAAMPRWNQVAKVGRFLGHPAGPFELTPAVFDEIIRNFKEVDGSRVPIDFEHASEADESAGNIPVTGAPAQGWVTDLQSRGNDGLFGLTSFLEPALSYVRDGRYRSFSPAIRFGAKHPESGKPIGARLTSVALVTRPFLRGLQPLAARDEAAPPSTGEPTTMTLAKLDDKHPHEMMKSLKAAMGLHDLSTASDMKDHLDKLRDHAAAVMDKPHGHAMGHVSAGGVNCGEYTAPMADLFGAPANMTTSELLDAIEGLIDSAMEIHEVTEHHMNDTGEVLKLGQRLGTAEEKVRLLDSEKTVLSRDNERLTLEIKAKDAKIAELETTIAKDATDLKTLRDAEVKREEETIGARVEEAFATYKDSHKLSDAHKPMMVRELKADGANFDRLYPRVAPNQQHLLRNLAGERTPTGTTAKMGDRAPVTAPGPTAMQDGALPSAESPSAQRLLADKLVKERHMTREAATSLAYEIATGAKPMPNFAS